MRSLVWTVTHRVGEWDGARVVRTGVAEPARGRGGLSPALLKKTFEGARPRK